MKTSQLDEVDRQLLHALTVAPRASFRLLAAVLGVSDQTVARRYRRLADIAGLRVFGLIDGQRAVDTARVFTGRLRRFYHRPVGRPAVGRVPEQDASVRR